MRSLGGLVLVVVLGGSLGGCPREDAAGPAIVQDVLENSLIDFFEPEVAGNDETTSSPSIADPLPPDVHEAEPASPEVGLLDNEEFMPPDPPAADALESGGEPNLARLAEGRWQTESIDCEVVERVYAGGPDARIDPVTQTVVQAWIPIPTPESLPCPQSVFDVGADGGITQFWFSGYRQVPSRMVDLPEIDTSVSWSETLGPGSALVTMTPYRSDARGTQVTVYLVIEVRDNAGAIVDRAVGYQEQWLRGSRDAAWARTTSRFWRQFDELPPLGDLLNVQYSRRARMQFLGE